jgi:hypothetical protein
MSRGALLSLLLAALSPLARAEAPASGHAATAVSDYYPQVACTGTDPLANADVLQLATDTREQLAPILQLGNKWRFPVHIILVEPDDPLAARIHDERSEVTAADKTMTLTAACPSTDPEAKSFIQRQFVTALLWEKLFSQSTSFDTHTRLDVVPLWLIEGLNETLIEDPSRSREEVVRRAALAHRAPSLEEITGWQEISEDRLLGLYQRAFCYYLVNSLIHHGAQRADFQAWLDKASVSGPASAQLLFPTEAGWQRQLLDAPERSHDLVYTWDESVNALAAAETIAVSAKKADDTRICTLDTVAALPRDDDLIAALQKKVFDLTALELRAHPSWRPILALYRFGLTALISGHLDQAKNYIRQAQQQRTAEIAAHQKLIDYVNWFEVTRDYAGASRFENYFTTAKSLETAQGDPDHPNAIRTHVLQVESRL